MKHIYQQIIWVFDSISVHIEFQNCIELAKQPGDKVLGIAIDQYLRTFTFPFNQPLHKPVETTH